MNPVMNDTKWRELRAAMLVLGRSAPEWRTRDLETGHISAWDAEWFYHFAEGGYKHIEWVELRVSKPGEMSVLQAVLAEIHLPGEQIDGGFRVYGYVRDDAIVGYIPTAKP